MRVKAAAASATSGPCLIPRGGGDGNPALDDAEEINCLDTTGGGVDACLRDRAWEGMDGCISDAAGKGEISCSLCRSGRYVASPSIDTSRGDVSLRLHGVTRGDVALRFKVAAGECATLSCRRMTFGMSAGVLSVTRLASYVN